MTDSSLSIVIPIFNDAEAFSSQIPRIFNAIKSLGDLNSSEVILVDNGSTDDIRDRLNDSIVYVRLESPNYGAAIKKGVSVARYKWVYVVDIDQIDEIFFKWSWHNRRRYDLFLSSKRSDPTINNQSKFRFFLSWGLNSIIQLLFAYPGTDTHGQKLINQHSCNQFLSGVLADRGQYDVELAVSILSGGMKVVEIPVPYEEIRRNRNALIKKIIWNVIALYKMYNRLKPVQYESVNLSSFPRSLVSQDVEKYDKL